MNPSVPSGPTGPEVPTFDGARGPLDPAAESGASLGASGAEASVDLSWFVLLRGRVQDRAKRSPRYQWWVLSALLAGLLSLNITFTVFVVALPTVARQLHTNYSVLTWSSTAPLLAFGLAAPVFGKAGDLFGHRRLYLLGLAGAALSAVITATAPNVGFLLLGRALDGVQGAATGTASMALILKMFAPQERVKALGWWSLVGAGGPVLGVTIGSPIIQYFGWRELFWGQLVLLVISMCVVALVLPAHGIHAVVEEEGAPSRWKGMDWVGSWSLSAAVTGAMLALSIGPIVGWSSIGVIASVMVSVAATSVFIYRELSFAMPMIPTKYLRRRNFVFPMGMRACANFGYFGGFFLFPLLMEEVYGYGITKVGIVSIARPLVFAISSPIAGYMAIRIGERTSTIIGACSVTVSMVIFALLAPSSSLLVIVVALSLAGLGMGVALPSTSATMANEVEPSEFGVMSAAQLLATQVGQVAGIQTLLTIQEAAARRQGLEGIHHQGVALLSSFHQAFWVGAIVAFFGIVCSLFMRATPRTKPLLGDVL